MGSGKEKGPTTAATPETPGTLADAGLPGVAAVINCVGYATRVGGSLPAEHVLQAMLAANRSCVEIDDLEAAASAVIAELTGAAAGIVTCGAAAGLTLAAAACLCGSDVGLMDRLPHTAEFPRREIIYPKLGPFDYDHALRLAGAVLVERDYGAADGLAQIEAAISPRTAAIGYCWLGTDEQPGLEALAALAHRHGLPLIVDGALSLPPVENLTRFVRLGADLVTFSGGKHLGGPQASGILCGRADLIRSAWLQMVDMDVRAATWSLRPWVERGWVARPPRHGIGRSMKIGKESIAGLIAAMKAYRGRDHAGELARWRRMVEEMAAGLRGLAGIEARAAFPAPNGQPYPVVVIESSGGGMDVAELQRRLRECRPKVILAEDEQRTDRATMYPMCLREGDAARVVEAIRHAITT